MSIAYNKRKVAINEAKKTLGYPIPKLDFAYLQANWSRVLLGAPIGTLQDIMNARVLPSSKVIVT